MRILPAGVCLLSCNVHLWTKSRRDRIVRAPLSGQTAEYDDHIGSRCRCRRLYAACAAGIAASTRDNMLQEFRTLPAFCRVAATLRPSADSDIKIEVWLPESGWNGKFQATGNGGWSGNIDLNALAAGIQRGYATASTDTGHRGGGGPWMQNREKLIDYGHRAVHEMTVTGKAIAAAFYGNQPRLSYFTGCSGGGRQGLMAAQRYPEDFDGIVAGAPALNATGRAVFSMYVAQNLHMNEATYIPAEQVPGDSRRRASGV